MVRKLLTEVGSLCLPRAAMFAQDKAARDVQGLGGGSTRLVAGRVRGVGGGRAQAVFVKVRGLAGGNARVVVGMVRGLSVALLRALPYVVPVKQ